MAKRIFETDALREWDMPWSDDVVFDEIYDHTRWSVLHECVFKAPDDGKFYRVYYSVGATESQDERPWQYDEWVEGAEVELTRVTTEKWIDVPS